MFILTVAAVSRGSPRLTCLLFLLKIILCAKRSLFLYITQAERCCYGTFNQKSPKGDTLDNRTAHYKLCRMIVANMNVKLLPATYL